MISGCKTAKMQSATAEIQGNTIHENPIATIVCGLADTVFYVRQ
jgi:hypothetical protein